MSIGKILAGTALLLTGLIAYNVFHRGGAESAISTQAPLVVSGPIEVELEPSIQEIAPAPPPPPVIKTTLPAAETPVEVVAPLPDADRIEELFNVKGPKLPIVETITYKSRVSWQKGRPAWLSDYASHYATSRHFIARSLNGKPDYLKQDIAEGDKFNVLRQDIPIEFQLVIDASRCKLWLYYIDTSTQEKVLLKTYKVSLGRPDSSKVSGLLTPLGKFSLGSRIAIYKPNVLGHHKGQKIEMIKVFGTRWIPFDKEISSCTAPAKGLGIHGVPWDKKKDGTWMQDRSSLGKYESDGCIRMAAEDIEEIYAIVITKPAYVEIVKNFAQSDIHKKK